MIVKGTVINEVVCINCMNIEGQKKVIDTFLEGKDVVIIFKCFACNGFTKVNFKPYLQRPFNGKGFTVSETREKEWKEDGKLFYEGIFKEIE